MTKKPSLNELMFALIRPFSFEHALDPFAVKHYSKASPARWTWTTQSRLLQLIAEISYKLSPLPFGLGSHVTLQDRGGPLSDTAVTTGQLELLIRALEHVKPLYGDIAEVGAYRGATTIELAARTAKVVYAIDPFIGYGGSEEDFFRFRVRTNSLANVIHLRETSGAGNARFKPQSLSMVFVDAVHDVSNSWYDFLIWSEKVISGGLIALHDVDDHAGVRFTARRVMANNPKYTVWGYCPNLLVLEKH